MKNRLNPNLRNLWSWLTHSYPSGTKTYKRNFLKNWLEILLLEHRLNTQCLWLRKFKLRSITILIKLFKISLTRTYSWLKNFSLCPDCSLRKYHLCPPNNETQNLIIYALRHLHRLYLPQFYIRTRFIDYRRHK